MAWISEQNVEVDCLPRELREDGTKVSVNFAEYPQYRKDQHDGKLIISRSISLEEAKRIDRGSYLWVHGVIEKIDSSVDGEDNNYIHIYVNRTKGRTASRSHPDQGPKPDPAPSAGNQLGRVHRVLKAFCPNPQ